MKRIEREFVCAACGKSFMADEIVSRFLFGLEMDGKPQSKSGAPIIYTCPHCGTQGFDIEKRATNSPFERADFALVSSWYADWDGKKEEADEWRRKAVQALEEGFGYRSEATQVITYLDLLRRLGEFAKARDAIAELDPLFESNKEKDMTLFRAYQFEKKLIAAGDMKPHKAEEVE